MRTITIKRPSKVKVITEGELNGRGIFGDPEETSAIKRYGRFPRSGSVVFHKMPDSREYYECKIPMLIVDSYVCGRTTKEEYLEGIGEIIDEYETDMMALFGEGEKE